MALSSRINNLRNKYLNSNGKAIRWELLNLLLEGYENNKKTSKELQYANIFSYLIRNMTPIIDEEDLIVGRALEIEPTEKQESFFAEIAEHNNVDPLSFFSFDPLDISGGPYEGIRFSPTWFSAWGHLTIDWNNLLTKGIQGIINESEEKNNFFISVKTCLKGVKDFINNYLECARKTKTKSSSIKRKKELDLIIAVCEELIYSNPKSFHSALQLIWFIYFLLHVGCGARDYGLGRLDQYLFPFYEKDINNNVISRTQALELLQSFMIKCNEICGLGVAHYSPKRVLSVDSVQYLIIGGQNENGENVCNDLSMLCLEAVKELKLKQPTIVVRYFKNINKNFWYSVCDVMKEGLGYPSVYNDETVIPAFKNYNIAQDDITNYVHYGCCNPNLAGNEGSLHEAWHGLPKYLELALNNGYCQITGKRLGAKTGFPNNFNSFDDLLSAFRIQVRDGVKKAIERFDSKDAEWIEMKPFAFESCFINDCILKAKDINNGGAKYKHSNHHGVGIATVTNSLASIKKLVYDDKRFSISELNNILKNNFRGEENLRREIINHFPKFGNDNNYVDEIAYDVGNIYCEEVLNYKNVERMAWPSFYSLWHEHEVGVSLGATADGRRKGEPVSENQSPVYGTDQNGPTALLNSISKLPLSLTPGGEANLKLHPTITKRKNSTKILMNLLDGFFINGGENIMLNVISRETLLDAKNNPDQYKDLLVRLVGWSVFFVTLSQEQQEDIIKRTEVQYT